MTLASLRRRAQESRANLVRPRRYRAAVLWFAALVVLGFSAYVFCPRTAHLRTFNPIRVGQLETRMWRSYYDQRYADLLGDLYALNRDEYGFSPADSLAIAWYAARAAQIFQPTRSRAEAQKALPMLERYYAVLRERGGETFDEREAARLELDWWQLRRENAQPAEYGSVIVRTTFVVFDADNAEVRRATAARGNDELSRQAPRRPNAGIRLGACRERTRAFL